MGKKQSLLRNYALKRKKGFKGTQKQEVAQKRRKETRAVEVTFVREDDVVSEQILGSGGCPGVPVHGGIPFFFVFISIHGVVTQFVNVSFLCVPVHEDTTKSCPSQNLLPNGKYSQTTMKAPRMNVLKIIWRLPKVYRLVSMDSLLKFVKRIYE